MFTGSKGLRRQLDNRPTAIVEKNGPDSIHPVLDGLRNAIRGFGYRTTYWDRRRHRLPQSNLLVIWNWNLYPLLKDLYGHSSARKLYVEKGWFEDRDYVMQVDNQGTGSNASWAGDALVWKSEGPLQVRSAGHLLICLRFERAGGSIDNPLPDFQDNLDWLRHFAQVEIPMSVVVRPHFANMRRAHETEELRQLVASKGWAWSDGTEQVTDLMSDVRAVAVVDSTVGSKALDLGLPVLCYGTPVYRRNRVVYCLGPDVEKTSQALQEVAENKCSLDAGAVKGMVTLMKSKEWRPEDVAGYAERLTKDFGIGAVHA